MACFLNLDLFALAAKTGSVGPLCAALDGGSAGGLGGRHLGGGG